MHLGLFMIRIHALHRRGAGTVALVVLRDTRWGNSTSIIGTMEVDLSTRTQLVYMIPDMIISVEDFHNHIEVAVQTHGYEAWQGCESNLLVTINLIGRLSNTSYMGFEYSVHDAVDHLETSGITAIAGERLIVSDLAGRCWHLQPATESTIHIRTAVEVDNRLDRSISMQFTRYTRQPEPSRYSVDNQDREIHQDEEEFIGLFIQNNLVALHHVPYDVCFCEACTDEAQKVNEEPLNPRRSGKPRQRSRRPGRV